MEGLSGSESGFLISDSGAAARFFPGPSRCIEPHRPIDVLQGSLAKIVEGKVGLAADLLECTAGQAHAARFALALDPRGDIDAVAEDVAVIDNDVSDIDADAKCDLLDLQLQSSCSAILP